MKKALGTILVAFLVHAGTAWAAPRLPPIADPDTGIHIGGKFIWFDLVTGNTTAARDFYRGVFDWEFEAVPGAREDYFVIRNEGRAIGGIFTPDLPRGQSAGTRWLAYASVRDMTRAVAAMSAGGSSVLVAPTHIDGRGVHVILRDSQGAIVGLLQSSSGDPPDQPVGPGEFFWVDLYAREPANAARAYSELGYEVTQADETGAERLLLLASGYARAGIMPLPPTGREPGWLPYVQVDDVMDTLARVRAGGGQVLLQPDAAVLDGRVAVIADPQGGVLGIIHWPVSAGVEQQP